jgi:hypothetical protein
MKKKKKELEKNVFSERVGEARKEGRKTNLF